MLNDPCRDLRARLDPQLGEDVLIHVAGFSIGIPWMPGFGTSVMALNDISDLSGS
jgi:hypothetical protein